MPYEPGTLRAEGYRDGEKIAETIVQIELSTRDEQGRFVPDATPTIHCHVDGPAHLVGMDGGNLRDLTLWAAPQRDMFAGLLLTVIQADAPGKVTVTISAEGMPDEVVEIVVA